MNTHLKSLLCRIGLHRYTKGTRVRGWMVRRCKSCGDRQELQFPSHIWTSAPLPKRPTRRTRVQVQSVAEETRQDAARGMQA